MFKVETDRCWTNFVKNSNSLPRLPAKTTIGLPFIELTAVDSTNIYAMDQVKANLAAHGTAYFAQSQTAGKGQNGKQWLSEPGENLILSVVLDSTFLTLSKQFSLSVMVALACKDLLQTYLPEDLAIKWPNDIYWCDRKTGGILIETLLRGSKWQWSVVGIGINVNQTKFPKSIMNPVSMKQITGKHFDPVALAKELCGHLEKRYQQLINKEETKMLAEYRSYLYKKDQDVKLKKGPIVFNATIKNVSEQGHLMVESGIKERFLFGEVEWVR